MAESGPPKSEWMTGAATWTIVASRRFIASATRMTVVNAPRELLCCLRRERADGGHRPDGDSRGAGSRRRSGVVTQLSGVWPALRYLADAAVARPLSFATRGSL